MIYIQQIYLGQRVRFGPSTSGENSRTNHLIDFMADYFQELIDLVKEALSEDEASLSQVGIALSTVRGAQDVKADFLDTVFLKGFRYIRPSKFAYGTANSVSGAMAIKFKLQGPNITFLIDKADFNATLLPISESPEKHYADRRLGEGVKGMFVGKYTSPMKEGDPYICDVYYLARRESDEEDDEKTED